MPLTRLRGFTLIEILVVLVIIGLLAGSVSLVVGGNRERRLLAQEAEAMMHRFNLIHDESVFAGKVFGFALDENNHFEFRELDEEGQRWQPVNLPGVGEGRFPDWAQVQLSNDDVAFVLKNDANDAGKETYQPQIVFTPGGEYTPFTLTLVVPDAGSEDRYTLTLTGDGYSPVAQAEGDAPDA